MIDTIIKLVSALSLGSLIIRCYDQIKHISDIDKKDFHYIKIYTLILLKILLMKKLKMILLKIFLLNYAMKSNLMMRNRF